MYYHRPIFLLALLVLGGAVWAATQLQADAGHQQRFQSLQQLKVAFEMKEMESQLWLASQGRIQRQNALDVEQILASMDEPPALAAQWPGLAALLQRFRALGTEGRWNDADKLHRLELEPALRQMTTAATRDASLLEADLRAHRGRLATVVAGLPVGIALLILGGALEARSRRASQTEREARANSDPLETSIHLESLRKQLTEVREKERQALAHDLHDGLLQCVMAADLQIGAFESSLGKDAPSHELSQGMNALRSAVEEGRRLIQDLRPAPLELLGLVGGVRQLLSQLQSELGWQTALDTNLEEFQLPPELETQLYRITAETLCNARKHSKTDAIAIVMRLEGDQLRLRVQDWGEGFDPDCTRPDSVGLSSMQARAQAIGGRFLLKATPGQGTRIDVVVPVPEPPPSREPAPGAIASGASSRDGD